MPANEVVAKDRSVKGYFTDSFSDYLSMVEKHLKLKLKKLDKKQIEEK